MVVTSALEIKVKDRLEITHRILTNIHSIREYRDRLTNTITMSNTGEDSHILMNDPVYAACVFIRDHTVDGSGDPFRAWASDAMARIDKRIMTEGAYTELYDAVKDTVSHQTMWDALVALYLKNPNRFEFR